MINVRWHVRYTWATPSLLLFKAFHGLTTEHIFLPSYPNTPSNWLRISWTKLLGFIHLRLNLTNFRTTLSEFSADPVTGSGSCARWPPEVLSILDLASLAIAWRKPNSKQLHSYRTSYLSVLLKHYQGTSLILKCSNSLNLDKSLFPTSS